MKTARSLIRLLLAVAGLALGSEVVSAANNPVSGISLTTALNDAYALAANRPDLKVLRVEGNSMLPFFGPGAVVIVKTMAAEKLREGMVVVYKNRFNETIAHRLINASGKGWTAAGYNNHEADSTPVTAENLVGVVYATFHTNALPSDSTLLASLAAKTPVALAAPAR
jgi:signal peptidase I